MQKNIFKRITLVLFGSLLGVLLVEIVLWAFHIGPQVEPLFIDTYRASTDKRIVYESMPNAYFEQDVLNDLGYRGPMPSNPKDVKRKRVLIFGDSISQGLLVDRYSNTYPAVVQQVLESNHIPAEVINFGVNGYGTLQEVATLETKGMSLEPDLIILQISLNDTYEDDGGIANFFRGRSSFGKMITSEIQIFLQKNSYLYRYLLSYEQRPPEKSQKLNIGNATKGSLRYRDTSRIRDGFELLASVRKTVPVIVVIFPWFHPSLETYAYQPVHQEITSYAKEHSFKVLDLLEPLQQCQTTAKTTINFDHVHPNIIGHRCAGRTIGEYIVSQG